MANPNTNLISSDALNVTRFASWGAAVAGILAAVVAIVAKLEHTWPTSVVVSLIGFAAVAFVVMGAVVIADMLVRRDLAKHVYPTTGNDPSVPLLYQIWTELRPDLEKAAPAIDAILEKAVARRPAGKSLEDAVAALGVGNGRPRRITETVEFEAR